MPEDQLLEVKMGRSFYEDDELITTKPGYNAEITPELKQKESSHGNIAFIEGMGVRTTPFLEKHFNSLRLMLHDKLAVVNAELGTQSTALANEWNTLRGKFQGLVKEPFLPGVVDVVFPALVGSILVHKRALPIRFLVPTLFAGVAFRYNMPRTYEVTKSKILDWEQTNFPQAYTQQNELAATACEYNREALILAEQAKIDLQRQVHEARKFVVQLLGDD